LDLQTLTVRQVMSPLETAVMVTPELPVSEALALFRQHKLTRLPVAEQRERNRRIIGLIHLDPLLYHSDLNVSRPARDHIKPALYLEEDLRLEIALRRMQRSGQRLAIVLGRDGREVGLLSLQDVLKMIFGVVRL
jgi:CBS domain containing-hemolysin-like protein